VTLLPAALLGIVQGLTEFLPVSSSAHLILARAFFGWDPGAAFGKAFDVACHVGTLLAVLLFFRSDIARMVVAVPDALRGRPGPDARRIRLIAAGTVPIVIVGGLWSDAVDAIRTPPVAAVALLAGAVLLLVIERIGRRGGGEETLTVAGAVIIGVAQSIALVPGVSRSGITIAAGMALGLQRDTAARFTFLMSIPAILAAAAKEALELREMGLSADDAGLFLVGMGTSAVVGYLTVKYFIRFLVRHRLDVFAWYRVALAAATFIWLAQ
jgi:undecaprenyl-diphosphatase